MRHLASAGTPKGLCGAPPLLSPAGYRAYGAAAASVNGGGGNRSCSLPSPCSASSSLTSVASSGPAGRLTRAWWDLQRFGLTPDKLPRRVHNPQAPPVFLISIPKSGTHLLERALCLHPLLYRRLERTLSREHCRWNQPQREHCRRNKQANESPPSTGAPREQDTGPIRERSSQAAEERPERRGRPETAAGAEQRPWDR